jgi:hypothetical protein
MLTIITLATSPATLSRWSAAQGRCQALRAATKRARVTTGSTSTVAPVAFALRRGRRSEIGHRSGLQPAHVWLAGRRLLGPVGASPIERVRPRVPEVRDRVACWSPKEQCRHACATPGRLLSPASVLGHGRHGGLSVGVDDRAGGLEAAAIEPSTGHEHRSRRGRPYSTDVGPGSG